MNYANFIVKIISKPEKSFFDENLVQKIEDSINVYFFPPSLKINGYSRVISCWFFVCFLA